MNEHGRPNEGVFFIEEAIGISRDDFDIIVAELRRLDQSDMNMEDIIKESVKGRNPHDVMVGFKLSTLAYENEGRL